MTEDYGIIDVWMQHPTPKLSNQPIFDSFRRWGVGVEKVTGDVPVEFTIGATPETQHTTLGRLSGLITFVSSDFYSI